MIASAYLFFLKTKQAKLNFSTNEYVLTPVKTTVRTSPQLFATAIFNLLHSLKHPE